MITDVVDAQDLAVLRVSHLSKTFPGTRALDDVSLEVRRGEIHALLGGNGSGKSTLIKILAGVYSGDHGGEISVGEHTWASDSFSPARARLAGLHFVHQNPAVFPSLTVAENMAIGRGFETGPLKAIKWRSLYRRTERLLERFHIKATPQTPVAALRPADRTMVAIARALQDQEGAHDGVLVLDEPTASLPAREVEVLLESLRRYAADGQTILYVSHRLDEVLDISDRVSVLRDGRHVGTVDTSDVDDAALIEMIVGRPLDRVFPEMPEVNEDEVVLEVRNLHTGPLVDVSFALKGREVLGIAGLLGSGRSELLQAIFGAQHVEGGEIVIGGRSVSFSHPRDAMKAGVAYVPEDRPADAAFADLSVRENLSAADVGQYFRGLRLRHRVERADAQRSIREFLVKTPNDAAPMATLSGGNQQKVILARWLRLNPSILLLDEPTQGVDVNARAEIYALVRAAVEAGAAAIIVTSDFDELAHVCDRALVLRQGRVVAELLPPNITSDRLTELAYAATEVTS